MNKNTSQVVKELEEFLNRDDRSESEVFPYCPECGKELESGDVGLCDGDIVLCDKCFIETVLGDDGEGLPVFRQVFPT